MHSAPFAPSFEEENELIARTLGGEADAFTPLLLKYKEPLFELASRILRNRAEAEDVLQDAFVDAFRHLQSFNHRSRFSTWLYSIVLNRIRNHLRHNKVVRWTSLDGAPTTDEDCKVPEAPERGPSAESILENRFELGRIQREVRFLPELYQHIFVMHYFQEMPLDQVAQRLERPVGTIKVYLHRARKQLYKRLATPSSQPTEAIDLKQIQDQLAGTATSGV